MQRRLAPWIIAPAFAALTLTSAPADATIVIQDPGFDAALNGDFTVDASDAGGGWRAPGSGDWAQDGDVDGHTAANRTGDNADAVLQVIQDGATHTGVFTLSFEAINTDTWVNPGENAGGFNTLDVAVYGVDSFAGGFTTGGSDVDANAVRLGGLEVLDGTSAENFGWTAFQTDVDLDAGYEYLVIRIDGKLNSGTSSQSAGELLAVDHIALVPEPASLALLSLGGLLMTFRKRSRQAEG